MPTNPLHLCNLLNIYDYKMGSPQTQSFTYDNLDRLTSASATGGSLGLYSESYSYDPNTGNLASKGGVNYYYEDPSHDHAVTRLGNGNTYGYDANGNMTQRNIGGVSYTLEYDAENRLTTVKQGATTIAAFSYDGDGVRVKGTVNGVTTAYVGEILEWTGSTSTMVKYYHSGSERVAMKKGTTLYWLIGDHLSSTSVVATSSGGLHSKVLYKAWGEVRYASASLPTRYTYTGQYSYMDDPGTSGVTEGFGLMFYKARWYDPLLSRFAQADTLVPGMGNAQGMDRYAYTLNNSLKYVDPTGHISCEDEDCSSGKRSTKDIPLTKRGQAVYSLYAQLKWKSGWWNHETPGSLSPAAFLGLMILWERSRTPEVESLLADAAKNQLWMDTSSFGGHPAYCQGQTCLNGVFNFLGAYGGGHTNVRVTGLLNGNISIPAIQSIGESSESLMSKANILGQDLRAYDRSRVAYNGNVPYHWGNDELIYNKVTTAEASFGLAANQIVYSLSPNFIIYTLNQSAYWSHY